MASQQNPQCSAPKEESLPTVLSSKEEEELNWSRLELGLCRVGLGLAKHAELNCASAFSRCAWHARCAISAVLNASIVESFGSSSAPA